MDSNDDFAVTVAIPTFRRPRLLQRAIRSALEQEGVRARICVFDNCSGDETEGLVRGMAVLHPQIRYYRHERNIGAAANFEFAMRSIVTPYFSLLSDDDYLLPGFYQRALGALEAYQDAAFWAGITLNADTSGNVWDARVASWPREGVFRPPAGALAMTGGRAPVWTGVLFRRRVIDRFGLPDPETLGPSDLDFLLRIAMQAPYLVEKFPAAVFTLNPDSYSSTQPLSSFWPGWKRMIEKVRSALAEDVPTKEALARALDEDAKRMLFRRGANALASRRLEFAGEAAGVLASHYGAQAHALMLRSGVVACRAIPGVQWLVQASYRRMERRLIESRAGILKQYSGLTRLD